MIIDPATRESIATEIHRYAAPMLAADDVYMIPRIETTPARDFDRAVYGDLMLPVSAVQVKGSSSTASPSAGSLSVDNLRPAIVFLHGGCWRFGSPSQFYHQSIRLAQDHGFVCLNLDYRMTGEAPYPVALHDAADGIAWLRQHASQFGIDPARVAVCGGSAGGHLASMLATGAGSRSGLGVEVDDRAEADTAAETAAAATRPDAAILINGEFDMWDLLEKGSLIGPMEAFFGGSPEQHRESYDENSSVHAVDGDTCPTLLLHGTEDNCVSHEQSVAFHKRLLESGVRGEIEIYQGKPHGWFNNEPDRSETYERMRRFLVDVLGLS